MGLLIGIVVVISIIAFMIISPGFRYLVLGLLVFGGLGLWALIDKSNKDSEEYRNKQAAQATFAATAIKLTDLDLSEVTLKKNYGSYELKGNIKNNSSFSLSSLLINVRMSDCSKQPCIVVGDKNTTAYFSDGVPTGQMRALSANVNFDNLPSSNNLTWQYTLLATNAK